MRRHQVLLAVAATVFLLTASSAWRLRDETTPSEGEYERAISSKRPVMVELSAPWCEAGRGMQPMLERLEARWRDRVVFVHLDADRPEGARMAEAYGASTLPWFVFVDAQGNVTARVSGALSEGQVTTCLEALLRASNGPSSAPSPCCGGADTCGGGGARRR